MCSLIIIDGLCANDQNRKTFHLYKENWIIHLSSKKEVNLSVKKHRPRYKIGNNKSWWFLRHGCQIKFVNCIWAKKPTDIMLFLLFSEFDSAAVVLLVGDIYLSGQQKRQWVFIVDGSGSKSESRTETGEICSCILAVSFFSPVIEDDCSFELFNKTLEGSTVVFFLYPLEMLIILHSWWLDAISSLALLIFAMRPSF